MKLMRTLVAVAAAAIMLGGVAAEAKTGGKIDLSTPEGAVLGMRKVWCTTTDGETSIWFWKGEVFSRKVGEADKKLFNVEGINVRTCGKISDPQRGEGVRTVSREILLYLDPKTNQVLSKWNNPWTGEAVDVIHVANDPVNGEFWSKNKDGTPFQWRGTTVGDQWFMTNTIPLFYKNPLGSAYEAEVGGTYHATEMFNFMGDTDDLVDPKNKTARVKVGWVRISDWLPWMKMGSREGMLYFHTAGRKVDSWDDLSPTMKAEVAKNYPTYRNPPPLDDKRPNETSWTYYKKIKEGVITPPKRD